MDSIEPELDLEQSQNDDGRDPSAEDEIETDAVMGEDSEKAAAQSS